MTTNSPGDGSLFADRRSRTALAAVAAVVTCGVAIAAWSRVGLLDLPSVPRSTTASESGLDDLNQLAWLDDYLRADRSLGLAVPMPGFKPPALASEAAVFVRSGIFKIADGEAPGGLENIRKGVRMAPDNLAIGNVYRMEVFRQRREYLAEARLRGSLTPQFPPHLESQPIVFFESLVAEFQTRETKLQLALAWVDEMLLFPALEIKAPASVQAVDILTEVIENGNENYVPALFARGLNHLHRPARLVWPESAKTPPDAAVRDIARCVAVGRRIDAGSSGLQAFLAMTLGDAYVKAGRNNVARSWWQIAQNLSHDSNVQSAVRRRYAWNDEEILDRLEQELDRARAELEDPMTDLALMWR